MLVLRQHGSRREWLHTFIADQIKTLALVQDRIGHQEFVDYIVPLMPRSDAQRDQRKFMAIRALRRMIDKGSLPCAVEGDQFVL